MRLIFFGLCTALFLTLSLARISAANVLSNPGFDDNADLGPWASYGPNNYHNTDANALSGASYYKVFGAFSGSPNWTGIYQDVPCSTGAVFTANGWTFSLGSDGGGIHGQSQFWLEVTFRDSATNALAMYRSSIVTGTNLASFGGTNHWFNLGITNQWSFVNSGTVASGVEATNTVTSLIPPAGTAWVRYQTVFYQGPDNANGSMYVDDCNLDQANGAPANAWNIVWSDEFNGTSLNPGTWSFETGNNGGWGNGELEYYTSRPQNAYVSNGVLHIAALKESYSGFNYTSARIKSQGLYARKYSRIEFRARLPLGLGFWPALWMLGANFPTAGWPACGEIDIMENKGSVPTQVQGTIHYSDASNNHLQSTSGPYTLPNSGSVTNFHIYRLDWGTNYIKWYVDDVLTQTETLWSSSTGPYPAPFDQPFFFIMNVAIGGGYLGNPSVSTINANTTFPQEMQIDYLRVLDLTQPLQLSVSDSGSNILLSWPANIVCHLQAKTNTTGLASNWADVPNAITPYGAPVVAGQSVLYRLQSP